MSIIPLVLIVCGLPLLAVAAGYVTVSVSYWWELRSVQRIRRSGGPVTPLAPDR